MDLSDKLSKLKELTEQFHKNIKQYKSSDYDEAKTRVDFIDKFFEILDWDVRNNQGFSEQYREVIREDKLQIEGKQKAPDYSFRIGKERKFFFEAKKPSVSIKDNIEPAFQIRRYGYTAKLPLSILTDFDELSIYDTRIKPDKNDKASVGRIFFCNYEEYEKHFEFIYNTFSKNAILKGSFDKYIEENKNKKGTSEVDKELLKLIEEWRTELAKNIALRNSEIDIYNLNNAVQKIIDRILFLRIAEDKQIEDYENLLRVSKNSDVYKNLNQLFLKANIKYNAGLFQTEDWISNLIIDDKILSSIIKGLYFPECPYEFSILPIEILGNIYEQFLGKTIRFKNVKEGHTAIIEEKPEVRKAGGVYYTPQYIVNYIVENTVGEKIKNKSPEEISKLKICDPACGSGSFLVGAYSYLLNYHLDYYSKEKNIKKALKDGKIYQVSEKNYKLTIEEAQNILINNIFGVDIDPQAVEVTKLSLYLKLLENEGKEAEGFLFKHSDVKLFPTLDKNIKSGNSLIGSDFYKNKDLSLFDKDEMRKINVFDWDKEFPEVFRKNKIMVFHHLVFETKYSRRKYQNNEAVVLDDNDRDILCNYIVECSKIMDFKIISLSILPDHTHLLIANNQNNNSIEKIIQKIKGGSSIIINKNKGLTEKDKGRQTVLWAEGYDNKILEKEEDVYHAIEYISNQYNKHFEIWGNIKPVQITPDLSQGLSWEDYESQAGGFDVVIGNPPYGADLNNEERIYLENKFKLKNTDTACLFMGQAIRILKKEGIIGFIIPKPFIYASNWIEIREKIFNYLYELVDCGKVWKEVKLEQIIYIYNSNYSNDYYFTSIRDKININKIGKIDKNTFKHFGFYLNGISTQELKIGEKILNAGAFLNDYIINQRGVGYQKEIKEIISDYKILGGKQINRYYIIDDVKGYIDKKMVVDYKVYIKSNSILTQNIVAHIENPIPHIKIISSLSKYIKSSEFIILDTINQLENISKLSSEFIISILNSKLISWYCYRFIFGMAIRTMHFDNAVTSRIPYPKFSMIEKNTHDHLVSLVDQMLETQKQFHNAKSDNDKKLFKQKIDIIDRQIDGLVYKLYGLTDEEIKIIENES